MCKMTVIVGQYFGLHGAEVCVCINRLPFWSFNILPRFRGRVLEHGWIFCQSLWTPQNKKKPQPEAKTHKWCEWSSSTFTLPDIVVLKACKICFVVLPVNKVTSLSNDYWSTEENLVTCSGVKVIDHPARVSLLKILVVLTHREKTECVHPCVWHNWPLVFMFKLWVTPLCDGATVWRCESVHLFYCEKDEML